MFLKSLNPPKTSCFLWWICSCVDSHHRTSNQLLGPKAHGARLPRRALVHSNAIGARVLVKGPIPYSVLRDATSKMLAVPFLEWQVAASGVFQAASVVHCEVAYTGTVHTRASSLNDKSLMRPTAAVTMDHHVCFCDCCCDDLQRIRFSVNHPETLHICSFLLYSICCPSRNNDS